MQCTLYVTSFSPLPCCGITHQCRSEGCVESERQPAIHSSRPPADNVPRGSQPRERWPIKLIHRCVPCTTVHNMEVGDLMRKGYSGCRRGRPRRPLNVGGDTPRTAHPQLRNASRNTEKCAVGSPRELKRGGDRPNASWASLGLHCLISPPCMGSMGRSVLSWAGLKVGMEVGGKKAKLSQEH